MSATAAGVAATRPTVLERVRRVPAVAILAERSYQSFWIAAVLAAAVQELRIMAQSWLILDTGAAQVWVGLAVGLTAVPAVPLVLFSGVLADNRGGRYALVVSRVALVLASVAMAVVVLMGDPELWQIVVLGVAGSAAIAFGMGPTQTMATALVARPHLQAAASLNSMSFSLARAVGPLTGGVLIASFGIGSPFLALCGLAMLALFFTLRIREPSRDAVAQGSPWLKVREGFAYVRQDATVRWLLTLALFLLMAFTWLAVLPVYARDVLHVGEKGYATLLATFAAGQGISALYVAVTGGFSRKGVAVVVSAVAWSLAAIVFGYSHSYPLSLGMMFVLGIVPPIWVSSLVTLLQISTPKDKVGRVMSLFALTVQIAQLSWLIGTGLGQMVGNATMIAITLGAFATANLLALVRSPQLRVKT